MTRILLVGCGKMGGALLAGWLDQGIPAADMMVIDPHFVRGETLPTDLRQVDKAEALPADFHPDVVLLAVKPQMMDAVLPHYRHFADTIFLSIAAGRRLRTFADQLGDKAAVVRTVPNTPAAVRRGITVLLANRQVTTEQRQTCDRLMRAVGEVAWTEDEDELDAVTALSGSGPAYVFLMVEAMAAAGEALGLEAELAQKLARATVIGAGELLHQSPQTAATLRDNVTSPNGTTFAALQVLNRPAGLTDLLREALAAAARRAQELAV